MAQNYYTQIYNNVGQKKYKLARKTEKSARKGKCERDRDRDREIEIGTQMER